MLLSLRIENFALIDSLALEFSAGLNVLTGETGAGKSIILDAIDSILGGKISSRMIRTGAERALLEASFSLTPALATWLQDQELDPLDGEVLVCAREIGHPQGNLRSRSRINGVVVNKQQVESLRHRLIEITAQGQTVQLGNAGTQREWLDGFGGSTLLEQRRQVVTAFAAFQQAKQALETYRRNERQRLQQLDLLEYQVQELGEIGLGDSEELTHLEQEQQRLSHSVELQQQSYQTYQALYQNEAGGVACADLLGNAASTLEEMSRYDPQVQPILELVNEALAQVEEASRQITTYGDALETDPQRLQAVEERLTTLKQICRKYGPSLEEVIAYYERAQAELAALTGEGQSLEALEQLYQQREAVLQQVCAELTRRRQKTAQELEARLIQELRPLAMEKVQFQVEIAPGPVAAHGADRITFLLSPNPGEPLQPLAETASGGEMSRFLLALKACFSQVDPVDSLIFDEIDVGVSGRVAQAIAQKLHQLSHDHQVLCVTHQPMVAAMAQSHYRVEKQVEAAAATERTTVTVTVLGPTQRREELAQLAGGRSAQEALAFAAADLRQIPEQVAVPLQKRSSKHSKLKSSKD
jgi:DNA repair protein RecN (Recombination protein N)